LFVTKSTLISQIFNRHDPKLLLVPSERNLAATHGPTKSTMTRFWRSYLHSLCANNKNTLSEKQLHDILFFYIQTRTCMSLRSSENNPLKEKSLRPCFVKTIHVLLLFNKLICLVTIFRVKKFSFSI
jgi:hypothetical protein